MSLVPSVNPARSQGKTKAGEARMAVGEKLSAQLHTEAWRRGPACSLESAGSWRSGLSLCTVTKDKVTSREGGQLASFTEHRVSPWLSWQGQPFL